MRQHLRITIVAALGLLGGSLWIFESSGWATEQPLDETSREIMWRKLDLSHNVLDALALDDFEALEAYAEDLEALGAAGFLFILDTDEYRIQAQEFRAAARALRRAAQEENTEAGALAYVDLTLRCIRCHRSLGVLPR
jgi:hypothetical protein